jgi:hypothetical protein
MSNLASLHGPRPVASAPSSDSYRNRPGRLITVAGFVRPSAVTADRDDRPVAAKKAA